MAGENTRDKALVEKREESERKREPGGRVECVRERVREEREREEKKSKSEIRCRRANQRSPPHTACGL